MKKNPVVHFEMPAKNKERVSHFYSTVFGWQMKQLGAEMNNYIVAGTAETDDQNMVTTPGTINGGFYEYKDEEGFRAPSVVISVDDIHASIELVKKEGGKVFGEPMDIPGVGIYISFEDTEGNRISMMQSK